MTPISNTGDLVPLRGYPPKNNNNGVENEQKAFDFLFDFDTFPEEDTGKVSQSNKNNNFFVRF